jgi:predicted chitinase
MMQLTGKTNYSQFTASHNQKNPNDPRDFVANPDLLVTDRQYGIESAFYFWDARSLNAIADTDNVRDVTIAINGGLNGLSDRKARLQRVKQALGI